MGIIRGGVLGGFSQKAGAVIGAYHRGQDTIRGLPRKSNKAASQQQKDQRFKFALVTDLIGRLGSLIDIGYAVPGSKITTPMNEALGYHLKNAVTGVSPNFTFDFTKLRFSTGNLEMPVFVDVESVAGNKVKFSWDHDEGDDRRIDGTDMVTLLIYNQVKDRFVYKKNTVARSVKSYMMSVPADFSSDEVFCYVSFNSVLKKNLVSKSFYIGSLPLL